MTAQVSADSTAHEPSAASPVDLSTLIDDLESGYLDLARPAILRARQDPTTATRLIIDRLRQASADAREGRLIEPGFCDLALCVLAEFHARDAVPAIVELLSLPGSLPEDLLEDGITESAPRVLASLAGDQFELLDAMVRDQRINEWSRAAALRVRSFLVRDGLLTREDAIRALQRHLREAIDRNDRAIGGHLVTGLTCLGAKEAYATISEAISAGIVDESLINLPELEEELGEANFSQQSLSRLPPTHIDDAVAEIEGWQWIIEDDPFGDELSELTELSELAGVSRLPFQATSLIPADHIESATIRHTRHVGRNEACPCGSGRKFKKCCGKSGA